VTKATERSSGTQRSAGPEDARFRTRLAATIVGLSIVGILAISVAAIVLSEVASRGETTRLVFGSVLPLLGTWIGTILAFYFARENFATATESTLRLTGQLTRETPVSEAMIRRSDMLVRQLGHSETEANISIQEITTAMQAKGFKRIPVLDQSGAAIYIIHDSLILYYAQFEKKAATDPAFLQKSLADLRVVPDLKQLSEALAFAPESAAVGDARDRMQAVPRCNDVFITSSGDPKSPVIGWLTNTLLATVE
jgi:hypothetical protein